MNDLTIRLKIPIPIDPISYCPGLTFTQWLPTGDDEAMHVCDNDLRVKLWFDRAAAGLSRDAEIHRMVNVVAGHVYADVTVTGVMPDLIAYLAESRGGRKPSGDPSLQDKADEIAKRSMRLALGTVNRLLAFVRSWKGQYWLREHSIDLDQVANFYGQFEAKACYDGTNWFLFGPSTPVNITVQLQSESRFIHRDEWDKIRGFVTSSKRTPLIRTLLAGAESLAASGQRRSALTEAVTALEVAVYAFARSPDAARDAGPVMRRVGLEGLKQLAEHMGLTGCVSYLLPVLLPEAVLPRSVIEGCRQAIALRQNVVHQGQRDVAMDALRKSLVAIRGLCEILEGLTVDPTPQGEEAGGDI